VSSQEIRAQLGSLAKAQVAYDSAWFFKTGPGEYGEGDKFLGLRVPQVRAVASEFRGVSQEVISELAASEYHEERLCALVILTNRYEKEKDPKVRKGLFDYYLSLYDLGAVNNWDLVDVTANRFGRELIGDPGAIEFLLSLARDKNLWKQRSAVILTFPSIAEFDFAPTLVVCEELIDHQHDLIHKAVGWALREVGKKDVGVLRRFLEQHAATMPRTALRYAIEKLRESERQQWLSRKAQAQLERGH
jgi:3-methyladenine DNA glycosylase AlkD